jgi:DNA-binding transcriptional LysR family regulator
VGCRLRSGAGWGEIAAAPACKPSLNNRTPFMSHLDHLRTFIEAYRLQSFSRAAESLGMTQPAASLHIQALESFVGKPLFVRRARGVTATEAADELARAVGPMLDGLEMRMASYRTGGESGGTVHIAGPSDFIYSRIAAGLAPLLGQGFRIRVHTGNRDRIYALLEDATADLAITASMPDEHAHGFARLLTERFLLVLAPKYRRSKMAAIPWPPPMHMVTSA